jgi:opacity protein-like surface antigen
MKPTKKNVTARLASCLLLAAVLPLGAQPRFQAGGNFSLAYPQRDFKKNLDNIGIGGAGQFLVRLGNSPLKVGASAGFWIYGSETSEEPFVTRPLPVYVDVTTTNSIVAGHLLFRLQPDGGALSPYVDGLMGFNLLSTSTSVKDQDDGEEIASSNNKSDAAWGYGFGGGLMLRVYDGAARGRQDGLSAVHVDLGVRTLKGGEAEYLTIAPEDAADRYVTKKSETDLVTWHLGVSFDFGIRPGPEGI